MTSQLCKKRMISICLMICMGVLGLGCYSFKGISIAPQIETFYVDQFQNGVSNAPPEVGQRFSEALKLRIINNSRLNLDDDAPDIEFTGTISGYTVQSVSPERNNNNDEIPSFGSTLNRLSITVQVTYINNLDNEDTWQQSFTFFEDYGNDTTLDAVQEEFTERIFEQITTDVFNKAFTNW